MPAPFDSSALAELDAPEPDPELMQAIASGDTTALASLYDRYRLRAYAVALRITGDPGLAEDVVQEAFLQAWRNAGRYSSSVATVKSWLLGIVHHRAVDAVRSRKPADELPDGEDLPQALTLPDPWAEVALRLDADAIHRALTALSEVQREVIELAYFRGLSQREIAIRTATPLGTVKSRARDALLVMRQTLRGEIGLIPRPRAG